MGLDDRDYMRKRREELPDESAGDRLESGLQATWQRRRKLIVVIGLCLLVLLAALILNAILVG